MKRLTAILLLVLTPQFAAAAEYHVSVQGSDQNDGSPARPLATISAAAQLAQPGDTITVHEGVYRERVNPPRGGASDTARIVYQAAPGERVEIKGSEVVEDWVRVQDDTWKATLPNSFFGSFNPYRDLIHGDWFGPKGREHHTGAVYLDGHWLTEAAKLEEALQPAGDTPLWFGQVDQEKTTIWAQFKGVNPNERLVEVNVRQSVFYPDRPGRNYLTVRGFILRHAATPWAPPTAEQIGLIGTHWSKGWIIENNVISHSVCTGVTLGKYGDEFDNTSADTAEGYVKTIERAHQTGWSKENIGHHLVRNNSISHCEQAGIVGSLGAVYSTITGNDIHDIHVRKLFTGAEMAGIKIHAAIDVVLSRNHVYRTTLGVWLDWMAQGTRVTANLFDDNGWCDLFVEVDHGPFLVDNNIFLSPLAVCTQSQGGAFAHNLMAGAVQLRGYDARQTPFLKAHATEVAGYHDNPQGDDRYYNNVLVERADLRPYDQTPLPVWMDGNLFLQGASPSKHEANPLVKPECDPALELVAKPEGIWLDLTVDPSLGAERTRKLVTTGLLGRAAIPNVPFEQPDGSSLRIDSDYFGKPRNEAGPTPGPFEGIGPGSHSLKVW